jgi:hypothetical protein
MKRYLLSSMLAPAVLAAFFCLPITAEEPEVAPPPAPDKPPTAPTGTRGNCSFGEIALGAIASEPSLITTTAAYPVLLFYIPETSAGTAEFVLVNASGELIYNTRLEIQDNKGIMRVSFPPEAASPLAQTGNPYRWEFAIICDESDRAGDDIADGQLQRLPLSADIQKQLQQANDRDRLSIYREQGLEDDAVIVIDRLRRQNPRDKQLQNAWKEWLEKSGLEELTEIPPIGD